MDRVYSREEGSPSRHLRLRPAAARRDHSLRAAQRGQEPTRERLGCSGIEREDRRRYLHPRGWKGCQYQQGIGSQPSARQR